MGDIGSQRHSRLLARCIRRKGSTCSTGHETDDSRMSGGRMAGQITNTGQGIGEEGLVSHGRVQSNLIADSDKMQGTKQAHRSRLAENDKTSANGEWSTSSSKDSRRRKGKFERAKY